MKISPNQEFINRLTKPVSFLVFSASLRKQSYNTLLARHALKVFEENGADVDWRSMNEFDVPSYNQDIHDSNGYPAGAEKLREHINSNDALVISSPEYNASIPGVLKNAIDWVSRFNPQPFNEKHILLMSASPSLVGGNRGLWAARVPFEHLGARVFPEMFSLAQAYKSFDTEGKIKDDQLNERFVYTIKSFMELVEAAKNYPCAKKKWFEFLSEKSETVEL